MDKRTNEDIELEENSGPKYMQKVDQEKKKKKKKKKIIRRIISLLLALFILFSLVVAGILFGIIGGTTKLTREDLMFKNLTTFVYDKNGNEYATLHAGENRMIVNLVDVSPYLPKAFISIEDERFEKHFGIDIKRTTSAVISWVVNGGKSSFGGSTITQQLVKNITQDDERSAVRKLREWIRAIQIETWLSKDEILEIYLNLIYLGDGVYGVQTASQNYFAKDAKDLSIAECAVIAGINQLPEAYNPYKYPEKTKKRQELVLGKMKELGYITAEQYTEAMAQELVYKKGSVTSNTTYITEAVIDAVIKDLQSTKGITKSLASKMIYSDGMKIYTNIDPNIQAAMEKVYNDQTYFPLEKRYNERPQSAMVIIDQKKGAVVALVGGAGEKTIERGLNRATSSKRQPGSTIKPIAVYGPGIDSKKITAVSVFDDIPFSVGGWNPKNWNGVYAGLSTVRKGIEKSMNIVAVKALQQTGVETSYTYMQKNGITTLSKDDKSLAALGLGGLTQGILPIEMAAAYGTFGNQGKYLEPSLYTKVIDKKGELILENIQETRQVFTKQSSYIMIDMLRDVVRGSQGTATYINIGGNPVAAKTGTTNDDKDRWFVGITPYYTGAVWYGFDTPKTVYATGQNPAAKIWNAVMKEAHKGLSISSFPDPGGISRATVCIDSGKLAGELCSHDQRGNRTRTEMFIPGTVPTQTCDVHVTVKVCSESNKLIGPYCPISLQTSKVFITRKENKAGVEKAVDYIYQAPTVICPIHGVETPGTTNGNTDTVEDVIYDLNTTTNLWE